MPEQVETPTPTPTPPIVPETNPAPTPPQNETMVPKYRFDEVNKRCQVAEAKILEYQTAAEKAKEKDAQIVALEQKLEDIKAGYATAKESEKKVNAIEAALKGKVVDIEIMHKLLDTEKITINEKGKLEGLEEQLKPLQKQKPYLWLAAKPVVKPGAQPAGIAEKTFAQKMAEKKNEALSVTAKSKSYFN